MTVWIGRIEPSMWFEGAWWEQMLPDDVRLAVLSLGVGRLTPDQLERAHEQILDKVEVLDREGVDVINVGGSPVVTAYGMAGHARLLEEIGARVSRPYVTALQAELEGLRAVGGTRVAVASPYPIAQTERRLGILEEEGFVVAGHESLDIERNREIAMLDPGAVADLAVRVAAAAADADVVYLPCGSLPAPSVIDEIEDRTGLPAVTCAQAQVAACLTRVGYAVPIEGYGRLLRELAPIAA
jgi:maleate cis-trans isomerase